MLPIFNEEYSDKKITILKIFLPFFHHKCHISPTFTTEDLNISPVKGYKFSMLCSTQNIQLMTECNGVNKYVCKYIWKIDKKNYVVISVDNNNGTLVTRSMLLHNNKVYTSKINEDKSRENNHENIHSQEREILSLTKISIFASLWSSRFWYYFSSGLKYQGSK